MSLIDTFKSIYNGSGTNLNPANDHTTSSPVVMQAGDALFAMVFIAAIGSPSSTIAATVDDVAAPPGWLRLDADTVVESGDPSVLTGVVALYAYRAPAGATQQFTWSWRLPANGQSYGRGNGQYAMIYGLQYRGPVGVGGFAADRTFRRAPTTTVHYPAPQAKAGTGNVLRAAILGIEIQNPQEIAAPAGHTNLIVPDNSDLNSGAVYVFPGDHVSALLAAADVAAAVPGAADSTWSSSGTLGAGIAPALGWTIFLSDVLAPLPPTLVSPADGSWVDLAAGFTLELQHNTLGTVGDLSGIALWRSTDGGATKSWWKAGTGTWEVTEQTNTTTVPQLVFPAAKWANAATDYLVGIATTGSGSTVLSEYTTFHLIGSDPPAAGLTVTGLAGGLITDLTPTAVVSGTPAVGASLDAWQVRVFDLVVTGTNLASNASFESGVDGWAGAVGYVAGACEPSDQHATHGDTSMLVTWPGGGICGVSRLFPVVAGKTYTWSAYIWISADSPGVAASWLGHSVGEYMQFKQQIRRIQHTFTANVTGSIPLGFETATGRPGSVYIDRIALVEGTEPGDWVYSEPEAGTPTVDSGVLLGQPGEWTVPYEDALTTHQQYQFHAKVRQSGGQWSPWVTLNVEPNVDTPDAPTISVTPTTHETSGLPGLAVTVVMPAWTGMPMTARVQRLIDGAWVDVGTAALNPGGSTVMTDYTCPSDAPTEFRVRAETTDLDGAPLNGPWSASATGSMPATAAEWVFDPAHPETAIHVPLRDSDTPGWDSGSTGVRVIDRPDAVIVTGTASLDHGSTVAICTSLAQRAALEALLKSGQLLLARLWVEGGKPAQDRWLRVVGNPSRAQLGHVDHEGRLLTFAWEQQPPPWDLP